MNSTNILHQKHRINFKIFDLRNIYLFIISLCCLNSFSQENSKIDSLKFLIEKEKNVEKQTGNYYQLGNLFKESNADSALHYYETGRKFAKENKFLLGEAQHVSYAISVLNKQGKFREALFLAEASAESYKKLN